MSRSLIVALALTAAGAPARADDAGADPDLDDDRGTQGIGVAAGIATGGRTTPGGLRIAGHYTYQMSSTDWFDGSVRFTFGGGGAACFRDRDDTLVCEHGYLDGAGAEISAGVRRYFPTNAGLRPFVRAGIGVSLVRFSDDDITGIALPLHGAVGLRRRLSSTLAIVAASEVMIGLGRIGRAGPEPQAGFAITAGAELRLR